MLTQRNFYREETGLLEACEDVRDFHRASGQPIRDTPTRPDHREIALRHDLIDEEVNRELMPTLRMLVDASDDEVPEALAAVADAIADAIYVELGTAVQLGIPIAEVWRRVHASNMAKFRDGVILRDDGKVLKPQGWQPPDVIGAIRDAMK